MPSSAVVMCCPVLLSRAVQCCCHVPSAFSTRLPLAAKQKLIKNNTIFNCNMIQSSCYREWANIVIKGYMHWSHLLHGVDEADPCYKVIQRSQLLQGASGWSQLSRYTELVSFVMKG